MNSNTKKRAAVLTVFSGCAGVLLAIFRILASQKTLESGIELYRHGAMLPQILHGAIAAVCVLCLLGGIWTGRSARPLQKKLSAAEKKEKQAQAQQEKKQARSFRWRKLLGKTTIEELHAHAKMVYAMEEKDAQARERAALTFPARTPLLSFSSMFMGFILCAFFFWRLRDLAGSHWTALAPLLGRRVSADSGVTMASAIFTLCFLLSLLPAAIFFFKAAFLDGRISPAAGFCAVFAVFFLALLILYTYFDNTLAFNSQVKMLRLLTLICFALFAAQETRWLFGMPEHGRFFVTASLASMLGLTLAISDLVLFAQGKIALQDGYIAIALEIGYALYAFSRLLSAAVEKDADTPDAGAQTTPETQA